MSVESEIMWLRSQIDQVQAKNAELQAKVEELEGWSDNYRAAIERLTSLMESHVRTMAKIAGYGQLLAMDKGK